MRVEVGGHTNGLCDDEYCINLSKERAESVIKYLVGKGIDSSRMTAAGYGKKHPIASNDTPEGRKRINELRLLFYNLMCMFWQKLFVCVFLLQFISANVFAQEDIYWAHSVVDFSSQRSDKFFLHSNY